MKSAHPTMNNDDTIMGGYATSETLQQLQHFTNGYVVFFSLLPSIHINNVDVRNVPISHYPMYSWAISNHASPFLFQERVIEPKICTTCSVYIKNQAM